ncbi:MAG: oxidoreductase [Promethearchaeota archaeon]
MTRDLIKEKLLLSSPFHFKNIKFQNRFVSQPMERCSGSKDGKFTDNLLETYLELASGQWGILYLEAMTVMKKYKSRRGQLVIIEETKASLENAVKKIKSVSPTTKIIFQLTFPGVIAGEGQEKTTIIPSVHERDPSIKLLMDDEIKEIQDAFRSAISITLDVGADGVDVKGCHGYLVSEFLRPSNTRKGRYGGSFANRTRFFKELFQHARKVADHDGKVDFLIGSRLSVHECIRGGFGTSGPEEFIEDLSEPKKYVLLMHESGANFVNVSAGIPALMPEVTRPSKNVPCGIYNHFRLTREIKHHLLKNKKEMLVIGSAYTMLQEELAPHAIKNIQDGNVDMIGLGRQTLADPLYPLKFSRENVEEINYCIGCNGCANLLKKQDEVSCVQFRKRNR